MPKLPTGMRRNASGSIEYRFRVDGKYKSVSGKTVAEARAKANTLTSALEAAKRPLSDIDIETYAEHWLRAAEGHVKPQSVSSYRKKIGLLLPYIGTAKIREITRQDLIALQADLARKYSTSTANYLMWMIKTLLSDAVADEIIDRSPYNRIKGLKRREPKAVDTIHKALSKDEQERFFRYAADSWYLELFQLMLVTGMRVGEACALTWADIDDGISITKTVARDGTRKIISAGAKTDAGYRVIPLTDEARKILSAQKWKVANICGLRYVRPDERIFRPAWDYDGIISNSMADHAIDSILKRMERHGEGIPRRTSHALRDTFATRCIEQGMPPNTLKKILGHDDIKMTMDLYAQVLKESADEAMNAVSIGIEAKDYAIK